MSRLIMCVVASLLMASSALAQATNDPFSAPIPAADGVITANVVEFASLPDVDGQPARMMLLVDEPGTGQLFVNDMRGLLYSVSYDGEAMLKTAASKNESPGKNWGMIRWSFPPAKSAFGCPPEAETE